MENKKPKEYMQNHVNWCWATCSKIVGFHYLEKKNGLTPWNFFKDFPYGVVREDNNGLIAQNVGMCSGNLTVDAWQWHIVAHCKNNETNPQGNEPEFDDGKWRALKYVVTGDISTKNIEIKQYGYFDDEISLYHQPCFEEIRAVLAKGYGLIGNIIGNNKAHSVVVLPSGKNIKIFNPLDGETYTCRYSQGFDTGFLTSRGQAVIKWVQYINP